MGEQASEYGPKTESHTPWHGDRIIVRSTDDRLERRHFARAVADRIALQAGDAGLIVAIIGPWGTGKSSILALMKEHWAGGTSDDVAPVVVQFTPWRRVEDTDLFRDLLQRISNAIDETDGGEALKVASGILGFIGAGIDAIKRGAAHLPPDNPLAHIQKAAGPLGAIIASLRKHVDAARIDPAILDSARDRLEEALAISTRRVVILLDELDRMQPADLTQLLRIIKGVANLPNLTYVVAYDDTALHQLLKSDGIPDPAGYLEKIVQVPIRVPRIERDAIERLVADELRAVFQNLRPSEYDDDRFAQLFFGKLDKYFETVRHVRRFMNAFTFAYGSLRHDTDAVDLIGIVALQVFEPELLDRIQNEPGIFVDMGEPDFVTLKERVAVVDQVLDSLNLASRRERIKSMLAVLFPATSGTHAPASAMGVANPRFFHRYFLLHVTMSEVDSITVKSLADAAVREDRALFLDRVRNLGERAFWTLVDDVHDRRIVLSKVAEDAACLISALFDLANEWADSPRRATSPYEATFAAVSRLLSRFTNSGELSSYLVQRALELVTSGFGVGMAFVKTRTERGGLAVVVGMDDYDRLELRAAALAAFDDALEGDRLSEDRGLFQTLEIIAEWSRPGIGPERAGEVLRRALRVARDDASVAARLLLSTRLPTRSFTLLEHQAEPVRLRQVRGLVADEETVRNIVSAARESPDFAPYSASLEDKGQPESDS